MARPARVGIDLTPLLPVETGVDTYLRELVPALARQDRETSYHLFINRGDEARLAPGLGANFTLHPVGRRGRVARLAVQQVVLPALAGRQRIDVLHSPSYFSPLLRGRARHLLTVFDMTFFTHPACHTRLRRSLPFRLGIARSIRRAHLVNVPTEFVRSEVLRLVRGLPPDRVRVVPLGVGANFTPARGAVAAAPHGARERPYVLFVGTLEPRKDLETLLEGFRQGVTSSDHPHMLVIAGKPGWGHERLLRLAGQDGLRGRVRFADYVPESDLAELYRGATCFVYPSLAEGFGLPPLEAMACGIPTIVTETSALRENLAGAAELVPIGDAAALGAALARLLGDDARRDRLSRAGLERAREFTWERTARLTRACYEELARVDDSCGRPRFTRP